MFDAWGISIFVGFDFHNVDALRLKSRKELLTLLFRKLLILRIYSILFDGIKKLPAEHVGMKKEMLLQWMAESQMLEKANVRLNDAAIQISEWFRKKGFRTCILKGQGNALMYPNPYSRTPGDIDIWVEGGDKRVISFVSSISPHEKACYHHIEFPSYKGVEVEVHYRPSFLLCFWHNRKLQKGEGGSVLASGNVGGARGGCNSDCGIQSHLPIDSYLYTFDERGDWVETAS